MSVKYTHILETVEDEGVKLASYYGKYLVQTYDEALSHAKAMDFVGGVRTDGVEKAGLFMSKEQFEDVIKDKDYPVAIVPLV